MGKAGDVFKPLPASDDNADNARRVALPAGRPLEPSRALKLLPSSGTLRLIAKILAPILVGFLLNLISEAVSQDTPLISLPRKVGWWTLLAPVGAGLLAYDLLTDLRSQRNARAAERRARQRSAERLRRANEKIIGSLILLLAKAARDSSSLNIHVFWHETANGHPVLVKDRRFFYETEHLPANYSLDAIVVDRDELVVCEAFRRDELIFEELPPDHPVRYNERIRNKVDPGIGWVLACPMHVDRDQPAGVLCAFGGQKIFANREARRDFESLMWLASDILATLRRLEIEEAREISGGTHDPSS